MTDENETSEDAYLKGWKGEIKEGVDGGKLTRTNGRADIRTIGAPSDEYEIFKQKHGK